MQIRIMQQAFFHLSVHVSFLFVFVLQNGKIASFFACNLREFPVLSW